ncbi:MAG: S4 domain-containing protein [Candidatus Zixiibacteriota bacterium]
MRLDDYLSTVGIVKRRTVAKDLAANRMVEANGRIVKPSYQVRLQDIIQIKGSKPVCIEVLALPTGSIPKPDRDRYFKRIALRA